MRLIRRNGELVTFGTLRAWEMLLEGPEKARFRIWGIKIIAMCDTFWKMDFES